MNKHTPTPWALNGNRITGWKADKHILALDPETLPVDAEFIVRAVNSHDELLEAAKEALALMDGDSVPAWANLAHRLARAIDKAEGK